MATLPPSHVQQLRGGRDRERDREYDRGRADDRDRAFLRSARWQKVRRMKLSRNPLCENHESRGDAVEAVDVHHVKPRRTHPELAFALSNLRSLCRSCHRRADAGSGHGA